MATDDEMDNLDVGPDIDLCWRVVQAEAARRERHDYKPDFAAMNALSFRDKKNLSLVDLGVKVRTSNSMELNFNVLFAGQLTRIAPATIFGSSNIGKATMYELQRALGGIGLDELWATKSEIQELVGDSVDPPSVEADSPPTFSSLNGVNT
jgi:hypothetical protein